VDRETPTFRLHGSASRQSDGTLRFSSGAPWGRAESEDPLFGTLRGLRSFTIMGWLKPESLRIGSGGNRIVFCLNRDRSGIDLVCLSDGRLRLAVNQWPDGVQNDSSAGKLQPGKWTFFAVSYDSTRAADNVTWYFTDPADMPGPATPEPDRHSTHNAGAVATDPGPVAIGNFNRTMEGYGYDRQFRGEIRSLQIFGSRVGRRGAFSAEQVREHAR
jgi:hypothetical protein